jgi:hypothetical protein
VDQIGLTRETLLPLVNLGREDVGPLQELSVSLGVVVQDAVEDVVEAEHALPNSPLKTSAWKG